MTIREPSKAELAKLTTEKNSFYSDESQEALARRIFREALPAAACTVVDTMLGGSEKVRLDAAKYIVERNLGKIGEDLSMGSNDLLTEMAAALAEAAEQGRL